jgi:hypothetical protein
MNDDVTRYCAELCELAVLARDFCIDQESPEYDNAEPATPERLADLRDRFAALEQQHRHLALLAQAFFVMNGAADERYGSLNGYHLRGIRQFLFDGLAPWQWSYESQFEEDLAAMRAEAGVAAELSRDKSVPAIQSPPPRGVSRELPIVNLELNQVRFAGECKDLPAEGAQLLNSIVAAYPHDISASSICSKPSEVKYNLPEFIRDHIKLHPARAIAG